MLGLRSLGIPAISLSSLTPKEDVTAAYKELESNNDIRFVYGGLQLSESHAINTIFIPYLQGAFGSATCKS